MNVYIVWREGHPPEGAFETSKLAQEYIKERQEESQDREHQTMPLELVKTTDRPDLLAMHGGYFEG
jgi:hypothetical protein